MEVEVNFFYNSLQIEIIIVVEDREMGVGTSDNEDSDKL